MKKHKFIIEIEIPEGVNITEMKNYIYSSIISLCRSLHPYKDLNRDPIKVVHATRAKAAELLLELQLKGKRNISVAAAHTKNYGGIRK